MKRYRKEKEFLEQIKTVPNVSLACEKVGLSRNTVYRWCKEDPEFKERLDVAISTGTDSINDLAESKLIGHINSGNLRAIQYWLDNNKRNYARPRPRDFWETIREDNRVASINITMAEDNPELKEKVRQMTEKVRSGTQAVQPVATTENEICNESENLPEPLESSSEDLRDESLPC